MNPLQADASSPDTQAPSLVGPIHLDFATTNSLKFEFETSEFCRASISYNGRPPVIRIPFNQTGDHHHWYVLNQLLPDTDYTITLELRDAAGNVGVDSSTTFRTRARVAPDPSRVDALSLTLIPAGGAGARLRATVRLRVGSDPAGAGYVITPMVAYLAADGTLTALPFVSGGITNATGTAGLTVDLPPSGPSPGTIYFSVRDVIAPPGGAPYAVGLSRLTVATAAY
jgi:hypothetical protein